MSASPTPRPGRNEPCYCGSGKKYKQCCLAKDEAAAAKARADAASATASAEDAAPAAAEAASAAPTAAPKHKTHQPWKATTSRGFVPRSTAPRKMGGG